MPSNRQARVLGWERDRAYDYLNPMEIAAARHQRETRMAAELHNVYEDVQQDVRNRQLNEIPFNEDNFKYNFKSYAFYTAKLDPLSIYNTIHRSKARTNLVDGINNFRNTGNSSNVEGLSDFNSTWLNIYGNFIDYLVNFSDETLLDNTFTNNPQAFEMFQRARDWNDPMYIPFWNFVNGIEGRHVDEELKVRMMYVRGWSENVCLRTIGEIYKAIKLSCRRLYVNAFDEVRRTYLVNLEQADRYNNFSLMPEAFRYRVGSENRRNIVDQ